MIARLFFALALLFALPSLAAAEIVIGAAGPLSGQYADLGEQLRRGAQQAVDDLNGQGGVLGQQVKLEAADDRCDAGTAIQVAKDLVGKGARLVVGHYCSQASLAASPAYEEAGILMISPASSAPELTANGYWNVFRLVPPDGAEGVFAGRWLAGIEPSPKIAVLDDGTAHGRLVAGEVRRVLDAAAVPTVMSGSFKPGEKDFGALVARLKASGADMLYAAGGDADLGRLLRQMRDKGVGARLVSGDMIATDEFRAAAGDAAEGTRMSFPADPQAAEAAAAVIAAFKKAKFVPEGATLRAYAAVQAWARAAAVNGLQARRIAEWLRAGNTVPTVIGNIAFDAKGDLKTPPFIWLVWRDDAITLDEPPPAPSAPPPP